MNKFKDFLKYQELYMKTGDCDPAITMLKKISNHLNLNLKQRYWLSFLYGNTYNSVTPYFILNKYPYFEQTNYQEFKDFWDKNKEKLVFTSDRKKFKNFNSILKAFKTYKTLTNNNQKQYFNQYQHTGKTPQENYKDLEQELTKIYSFGRFTLFNYIEALHEITPIKAKPPTLNLENAESCKNGLKHATGKPTYKNLKKTLNTFRKQYPELKTNLYQTETALCGFNKLHKETRYLGYYLDRQHQTIKQMEKHKEIYKPYWKQRKTLNPQILLENTSKNTYRENYTLYNQKNKLYPKPIKNLNKYIPRRFKNKMT